MSYILSMVIMNISYLQGLCFQIPAWPSFNAAESSPQHDRDRQSGSGGMCGDCCGRVGDRQRTMTGGGTGGRGPSASSSSSPLPATEEHCMLSNAISHEIRWKYNVITQPLKKCAGSTM